MMKLVNSPIDKVCINNVLIYIKRDDLLHPDFSGNKARKLYYFFKHDFSKIKRVVSYGSMQSNAMYSLSVLANMKGWEFFYYTKVNERLLQNPGGNLKVALKNGMKLHHIKEWEWDIGNLDRFSDAVIIDETLIIPEGIRCKEAEYGIKILAEEIKEWSDKNRKKELNIFLPSGTGTTALYLKKHLVSTSIEVYTTPCVKDERYLKEQFFSLEKEERFHPIILCPPKKYRFGKLYKELFTLWKNLKSQTGIEFDLLYDPIGFQTLLNHPFLFSYPLMYIHQGGVLGNLTMLERYMQKN